MGREERGEFEGEFQADVVVAQVSLVILSKGPSSPPPGGVVRGLLHGGLTGRGAWKLMTVGTYRQCTLSSAISQT